MLTCSFACFCRAIDILVVLEVCTVEFSYCLLRLCALFVFSGLEGASQTLSAKMEKHRRPDDQNYGANEETARVRCSLFIITSYNKLQKLWWAAWWFWLFLRVSQLVVFPVLAARHPGLSDLFVCRWRPKGDPGRCGEQRDLPHRLQPIAALLPGQHQRATGIYLALGDVADVVPKIKTNQIVSVFVNPRFIYCKTVSRS